MHHIYGQLGLISQIWKISLRRRGSKVLCRPGTEFSNFEYGFGMSGFYVLATTGLVCATLMVNWGLFRKFGKFDFAVGVQKWPVGLAQNFQISNTASE